MRWFVVASVAVWSASALAADVSDAGVILLPPVVVLLGAADLPNASSPTQRDPSATTTVIETKSRVAEAKDAAELIAASPGAVLQRCYHLCARLCFQLAGAPRGHARRRQPLRLVEGGKDEVLASVPDAHFEASTQALLG